MTQSPESGWRLLALALVASLVILVLVFHVTIVLVSGSYTAWGYG